MALCNRLPPRYEMNPFPESLAIAQQIRQNSGPEDRDLVARPDASHSAYAIDRGQTARRFVQEARENPRAGLPWVAVYRRIN